MIRILWILALVFISLFLGLTLKDSPGYVFIAFHHWTLESTAWVAIIALVLIFFVSHILLNGLHSILSLPQALRARRDRRRARKAEQITNRGMIEYSEGKWQAAKRHLTKALPSSNEPLVNYLTAAKAAQKMGDIAARDEFLHTLDEKMPQARIAVKLTQAELQMDNQQWDAAAQSLDEVEQLDPYNPFLVKLRLDLYQAMQDWPRIIALLPSLKKQKEISPIEIAALSHRAYIQAAIDCIRLNDENGLSLLIKTLPRELRYDAEINAAYAGFLLSHQQYPLAESVLRRSMQHAYDEKLIRLYGAFYHDKKQLRFAESLIKTQPASAALYLCLGRLSMHSSLWGQAKSYLEKSLALEVCPLTCQELGKLHEHLGESNQALHMYKQGLELSQQTTIPQVRTNLVEISE